MANPGPLAVDVSLQTPKPRWVLVQGRTEVASTTDHDEGRLLAARCRALPNSVLYLEMWEPVRTPMEMSRVGQEPVPPEISEAPAAARADNGGGGVRDTSARPSGPAGA